jgi:hypothetical protein
MVLAPSFVPFLLLPLLALPSARGLTIETRSPDAHCPDLAMTQQAAEARLGTVKAEGTQGWRAVYTIVYAPDKDGNYVHLELFDPKGDRKLERDLPLAGESCATMTQAVVLVLERYFRDIGSLEDDSTGPPNAASSAITEAPPAPVATDRSSTPMGPSAPPSYRGSVMAGLGFLTPPASLALALEGRLWLPRSLQLGIGVAWSGADVTEPVGPPGGAARMTSIPVRASFAWHKDLGSTDVFIGPDLLASFDRASVTGVAVPGQATRVVLGLGVGAGALIWLGRSLALSIGATFDATLPLAMSQFVVNTAPAGSAANRNQEVLQQQWIQGLILVGVTYVTSP